MAATRLPSILVLFGDDTLARTTVGEAQRKREHAKDSH